MKTRSFHVDSRPRSRSTTLFTLAATAALVGAGAALVHPACSRRAPLAPIPAPAAAASRDAAADGASHLRAAISGVVSSLPRAAHDAENEPDSILSSPLDQQYANLVADMRKSAAGNTQGRSLLGATWDALTAQGRPADHVREETVLDPVYGTISKNARSAWARARFYSGWGTASAPDRAAEMRRAFQASVQAAMEANANAAASSAPDYTLVPISATNAPMEGFTGDSTDPSISTGSVTITNATDASAAAPSSDGYGIVNAAAGGSHAVVATGFSSGSVTFSAPQNNVPQYNVPLAPAPVPVTASAIHATTLSTASTLPAVSSPSVSTATSSAAPAIAVPGSASGTLYIGNYDNSNVVRYTSSGSGSVFASSGLSGPGSLAFDSAGNLYVANYNSGALLKYAFTGGVLSNTSTTFATGLSDSFGMAFDAAGNLYVSRQTNVIDKFTSTGGVLSNSFTSFTTSGLSNPGPIAFDSAGNLYVTNQNAGNVVKFAATGGVLSTTSTVFASGMSSPGGLAFDSAGDLFVTTGSTGGTITEYLSSGGVLSSSGTVFSSGQGYTWTLAFDSAGDLFAGHRSTITEYAATGGVLSSSPTTFDSSSAQDPYGMAFAIPEPGSAALLLTGLLAVATRRRRKAVA